MSSVAPPISAIYRWQAGELRLLDYCDMSDTTIAAADSWLVVDGAARGLDLHRDRFSAALPDVPRLELDAFWTAAIAMIPPAGEWFPRVERQVRGESGQLVFRQRSAPQRTRSVRLVAHRGADPREAPTIKGPDLAAMTALRSAAQQRGADEAVILSPKGFVTEGSQSALLWWRGDVLCSPSDALDRVDSVTARTTLTLATALGVSTEQEFATPDDLDGLEVWAVNALHGIRIVTAWVDGPATAEDPGRLDLWRRRLGRLSRPIATLEP